MSLPWSARQLECLREMGFDVLARRDADGGTAVEPAARGPAALPGQEHAVARGAAGATAPVGDIGHVRIPAALTRIAAGVDLAPLLAAGLPRDAASRRAFWRALRPLRKAARAQ